MSEYRMSLYYVILIDWDGLVYAKSGESILIEDKYGIYNIYSV